MRVYVVPLLETKKVEIEIEPSDTIECLWGKVKDVTGTDVSVQGSHIHLIWAGLNLSDHSRRQKTLADHNMQRDSTVYVVTTARVGNFFEVIATQ